jgi:hypothetical protein
MAKKIALGLLWIGFISYAFLFAPPEQPDTAILIQNLINGKLDGINPAIIALFNLMGIWPAIYSSILFIDGRMQKIWAWPFALGSFALGAFALLPYLALRSPNPQFTGKKTLLIKLVDSRLVGIAIAFAAFSLGIYGLRFGDWSNFLQQWQTSRFIHVMGIDFCLLGLLFSTVLGDDMARRGLKNPLIFWAVTLTPLFGAATYLALRPRLIETPSELLSAEVSLPTSN